MLDLKTLRELFAHSDWSNRRLLECAAGVGDADLDRPLEIGPGAGSLRRILTHTIVAEEVWLQRWQQVPDVPWPNESERASVADLSRRCESCRARRDAYLDAIDPRSLAGVQPYRDSKGVLYRASLGQMLLQGVLHSKHHQAQACNALRRLGAPWPELDYMVRVRTS